MSGLKGTVAVPKTGRNNNKKQQITMAKKNKNTNSTLTLATSESVQVRAPITSESPPSSDPGMEAAQASTAPLLPTKGKKRNKSVIVTDENEGVAPKKPKPDDSLVPKMHESRVFRNSRMKKHKKNKVFKGQVGDEDMEFTPGTSTSAAEPVPKRLKRKAEKAKPKNEEEMQTSVESRSANNKTDSTNNNRTQKQRKRKHAKKQAIMNTEEGPTLLMQRQSIGSSEEELTEVLGNMRIENNPFNLSDVVNEMVPSAPMPCRPNLGRKNNNDNSGNEFDLNKVVQWTRNNWNRDRIDAITVNDRNLSVVIENLPFDMIPVYKDKLMDLFEKYGHIIHIGPADMQESDGDEPSFNSTVCFDSEEAAINALDEDNTHFGGTRIRVRRPLPVIDPTCVGYCHYSQPIEDLRTARTIFTGPGPVRAARLVSNRARAAPLVKNDGPEAVLRDLAVSAIIEIRG